MKQTVFALVAVVLWVGVSSASMVVDLHDQPIVEAILEGRGAPRRLLDGTIPPTTG